MTWGSFGILHVASLFFAVGLIAGLWYLLKNKSQKTQIITLFILSLSGIAAIIFNLVKWGSPIEYLPFHMCSITALLLPVAILTRGKTLSNLLLIWLLGAIIALTLNTQQADYEIFSATFAFYYFPHVFEAGIPILMFKLKLWKKDFRAIPVSVCLTWGIYTIVHLINLALNHLVSVKGLVDWAGDPIFLNYMYSMKPVVPFMELFWKVIPHEYFYLVFAVPILVVYLTLVYLPQIIAAIRAKKAQHT